MVRLAVAFGAGLWAMIASHGPATAASPRLDESWRQCADSNADTRIKGCTEVIQSGEESGANLAAAYYNRGIAYREKSHYLVSDFTNEIAVRMEVTDSAIQDYDQAIRLTPGDAEAHNNRGIAYGDKRQIDRAIQDYDRAIRLKPDYAEAYYNRGNAYYRKSQYDRAIQDDDRAIAKDDKSPIDRAIQDYDRAIRLKPDYVGAFISRGIAYFDKGEFDRAIQDYDQAVQLKPDLAEPFNNRSLAYYKKGQYERALEDFQRTVRLNDNYGNLFVNRDLGASEAGARGRKP